MAPKTVVRSHTLQPCSHAYGNKIKRKRAGTPLDAGPAMCRSDLDVRWTIARQHCALVSDLDPGEEAVEAQDVGVVVRRWQQRVELVLVAESQIVPGGEQVASSDSRVARDLAGEARFQFRDRDDLPRAEGLRVDDIRAKPEDGSSTARIEETFTSPNSSEISPLA